MEEKFFMRYCPTCAKQKQDDGGLRHIHGYVDESIYVLKDGKCTLGHDAIQTKMPCEDYDILINLSLDPNFMKQMVELCESNPKEYAARIAMYKKKADNRGYTPLPKEETTTPTPVSTPQPKPASADHEYAHRTYGLPMCPTCGSYDVEKISLTKKAIGSAMFGLFSSNVRKTMHCKSCGYKW